MSKKNTHTEEIYGRLLKKEVSKLILGIKYYY